jgi:hypothetical protein
MGDEQGTFGRQVTMDFLIAADRDERNAGHVQFFPEAGVPVDKKRNLPAKPLQRLAEKSGVDFPAAEALLQVDLVADLVHLLAYSQFFDGPAYISHLNAVHARSDSDTFTLVAPAPPHPGYGPSEKHALIPAWEIVNRDGTVRAVSPELACAAEDRRARPK